ncbi:unnamed protein product [Arctogadus glacialis]
MAGLTMKTRRFSSRSKLILQRANTPSTPGSDPALPRFSRKGGGQVFGPREGERPADDSVELRSSSSAPLELLSERRGSVRGRAGNRPSVPLRKLE